MLRLVFAILMAGLLSACGDETGTSRPFTLPSGRVVNVQSYGPQNLFNGEQALVLQYVSDVDLKDSEALDADVAALWKEYRKHANTQQGVRLFLMRPSTKVEPGWDSMGGQAQYIYRKQPGGGWDMEKDPQVRLR